MLATDSPAEQMLQLKLPLAPVYVPARSSSRSANKVRGPANNCRESTSMFHNTQCHSYGDPVHVPVPCPDPDPDPEP